jgi:hypothetical protein
MPIVASWEDRERASRTPRRGLPGYRSRWHLGGDEVYYPGVSPERFVRLRRISQEALINSFINHAP